MSNTRTTKSILFMTWSHQQIGISSLKQPCAFGKFCTARCTCFRSITPQYQLLQRHVHGFFLFSRMRTACYFCAVALPKTLAHRYVILVTSAYALYQPRLRIFAQGDSAHAHRLLLRLRTVYSCCGYLISANGIVVGTLSSSSAVSAQ